DGTSTRSVRARDWASEGGSAPLPDRLPRGAAHHRNRRARLQPALGADAALLRRGPRHTGTVGSPSRAEARRLSERRRGLLLAVGVAARRQPVGPFPDRKSVV